MSDDKQRKKAEKKAKLKKKAEAAAAAAADSAASDATAPTASPSKDPSENLSPSKRGRPRLPEEARTDWARAKEKSRANMTEQQKIDERERARIRMNKKYQEEKKRENMSDQVYLRTVAFADALKLMKKVKKYIE